MKKVFALCAGLLIFCSTIFSQPGVDGFEFLNRDISEILYSISLYRGLAIVADDTVGGKATFRFAGEDFDSAFDSFLRAERLYVDKTEKVWTVSKVSFSVDGNNGYFLDASDVRPVTLVDKISQKFQCEITFDSLGESPVTLHTGGKNASDFVDAVARVLGNDYSVDSENGHFRINKISSHKNSYSSERDQVCVKKYNEDGAELFSVDVQDASAGVTLEELFSKAEKEFIFACDTSFRIRRVLFSGKDFDETLSLICSNCSLQALESNGIFYVLPDSSVGNSLADSGKIWKKHSLSSYTVSRACSLIENRFGKQNLIPLDEENGFLCFASENVHSQIADFIKSFDDAKNSFVVKLRYIHTDDFLSHLPPGVNASQIVKSTQDNVFFFNGNEAQHEQLLEQLKEIDCPVKRIRYDLLVMQYQSTEDFKWENTLSAKKLSFGDRNDASISLGSVLDFNLDVVSAFGLKFAASLQTAINENRAQVFADTTLQGVSGGTINFVNTNTYRYRDNNLNPETGKPIYTGVTREIASGLKIDVTGWISGDGVITSKVTASVSRQGADLSSSTGNPPPTSEKIITTEVVGKSGEPIVLSGLIQNEDCWIEQRTPLISKIPILGWLFKSRNRTSEKTEMVIYLVPHWDNDENVSETKINQKEFRERIIKNIVLEESK